MENRRCLNIGTQVKVELSPDQILKTRGLQVGGPAQRFFTGEFRRKMDPYVPFLTGVLKDTAIENVELPLIYRGIDRKTRRKLAVESLKKVGLEKRMDHKPNEMSGGQLERVAIASAIAARPPVILADEPTGNLDSASSREIMEILKGMHRSGETLILITHDNGIAAQARRVVRIMDGKIESDTINEEFVEEA